MLNEWKNSQSSASHYTITGQSEPRSPTGHYSSNFARSFSGAVHSGPNIEVRDEIVYQRSKLLLTSAVVDVRPSRTLHVTSQCSHGPDGRICGATHCALGATLPVSPLSLSSSTDSYSSSTVSPANSVSSDASSTNRYYSRSISAPEIQNYIQNTPRIHNIDVSSLDTILEDMNDNRTSTEWRSSFQLVRDKFAAANRLTPSSSTDSITPTRNSPDLSSGYYSLPRTKRWDEQTNNVPYDSSTLQSKVVRSSSGLSSFWWNSLQNNFVPNETAPESNDLTPTSVHSNASYRVETVSSPVTPGDLLDSPGFSIKQNGTWPSESYGSPSVNPSPTYQSSSLVATSTPASSYRPVSFSELNSVLEDSITPYSSTLPRRTTAGQHKTMESMDYFNKPAANISNGPVPNLQPKEFSSVQNRPTTLQTHTQSSPQVIADTNNVCSPQTPPFSKYAGTSTRIPNFSALDSAVEATMISPSLIPTPIAYRQDLNVIDHVSNVLRTTAAIVEQKLSKVQPQSPTKVESDYSRLRVEIAGGSSAGASMSPHSPSPTDTASTTSDIAPAGLPHPKPKHHLREQMLSLGVEPRSPTFPRIGPSNWTFAMPVTGSVAARVMEFEKRPTTPPAFQVDASSTLQPAMYRGKPVNQSSVATSWKPDIFEFESAKDVPIPAKDVSPIPTVTAVTPALTISSPKQREPLSPAAQILEKFSKSKEERPPAPIVHQPRRISNENIPKFYFPRGKPKEQMDIDAALKRVAAVFNINQGKVTIDDMPEVMKACGLPIYWKKPLFINCQVKSRNFISFQDFSIWWTKMSQSAHDEPTQFVYTLAGPYRNYLLRDDFEPMLQDMIDTFPGLGFLREAPEFHSRYVQTVISRIFFCVNRSWSGKISIEELRRSNFLQTVQLLESTDDINTVTDYFSYEHFYVIYCKFWELDRDHDLIISKLDLARHDGGAISSLIIDRVFSGAVSRGAKMSHERMNYGDFVSFVIAEEDKKHPTSIEYWFRCLDIDGDGILSIYEMEHFFEEIERKMEAAGIEPMKFSDVLCQMLDIVHPREPGKIRLNDLKRSQMATQFLNTFINMHKYYDQEVSDSADRAALKSETGEEMTDWERFCAEQYEILMQEEQSGDIEDNEINCDDSDDDLEVEPLSLSAPDTRLAHQRVVLMDAL